MKLHIKEQLRNIGYPETTDMKPPSQPVKTKGGPKKLKPTLNDNSTTRSLSYCEHVDKLFPDSPTPISQKSQKSSIKGARISKLPPTSIPLKIPIIGEMSTPSNIPFIEEMSVFMHSYVERIVDFAGDGNCGYRVVSALHGNGKGSHTKHFSHSAPPSNSNAHIMCIGWPSKANHFVQVYLKPGFPLPSTSLEWDLHHTEDSEMWSNLFVDRMHEFERLNNNEKEANKEKSKLEPLIDLAGDSYFDVCTP
ncbi:uncharacterized protein LOC131619345 [Vicia villosa]|uniref:uncharacterized protein LOC131619345 n=1 Tax=Vicia villosa TaxID=3911 RepID=UPI00273A8D4E|nr:uncharacterized protein LOC131619345 [Vicia villosa]